MKMEIITVNIKPHHIKTLDAAVAAGLFMNRSEAMRYAIDLFIDTELPKIAEKIATIEAISVEREKMKKSKPELDFRRREWK